VALDEDASGGEEADAGLGQGLAERRPRRVVVDEGMAGVGAGSVGADLEFVDRLQERFDVAGVDGALKIGKERLEKIVSGVIVERDGFYSPSDRGGDVTGEDPTEPLLRIRR